MPTSFSILNNEPDIRAFSIGQTIFAEGDTGDYLYYIIEGQVEIRRNDKILKTLLKGEIFGELALLDASPRSATALAKQAVKAAAVNQKRFLQMIAGTPFFAVQVMQLMADRLRHSNES
jgi:CRP/FNR family transcriptional regulator, cyclic AMP receptor protein